MELLDLLAVIAAVAVTAILCAFMTDKLMEKSRLAAAAEIKAVKGMMRDMSRMVDKMAKVDVDYDTFDSEAANLMSMVSRLMEDHTYRTAGVIARQTEAHKQELVEVQASHMSQLDNLEDKYQGEMAELRHQVAHLEWVLKCSHTDPLVTYVESTGPVSLQMLADIHGEDVNSSRFRGRVLDAVKNGLLRKESDIVRRPHQPKLRLVLPEPEQNEDKTTRLKLVSTA